MRYLAALLAMTACAPAPLQVAVTASPPLVARYAVEGETPAAIEVRRQLEARGLYAADAATVIRPGFAATPRRTGACMTMDLKTGSCAAWHDAPEAGFAPFAPGLRYRLTLDLEGGQIIVVKKGGKKDAPLPGMVTAGLDRLESARTDKP